jgi:spore coat protein A, manganese oxidase
MSEERGTRFERRALLKVGGLAGLALVLPVRLRPTSLDIAGSQALAAEGRRRFRRKLPIPRVITDAQIELPMRRAKVRLRPGRKTTMWTYDGTFPGPTIRRPAGEQTQVTFVHELPPKAGELSVHLHGGHNRSDDDGQPGGLTASHPQSLYCDISGGLSARESGNKLLIPPGGQRTYTYDLMEGGAPERAAFQWYHDHRLDHTAPNIWRGLAGMWIIDDDFDAALPLPAGNRDLALMIAERTLNRRNRLKNPFKHEAHAPNDGVLGRCVLVNGAHLPHHHVSAQRYRLRVLNASHFRAYNLELAGGVRMTQIATEAGLMPAPVKRRRVLIGPGERVELVVDFARFAGKRVVLRSVRRRGKKGRKRGSRAYEGPLMQFRVGKRKPDDTSVPATLRPLPGWVADAPAEPQRTWTLTVGSGLRPRWLINGRTFDPGRSDAFPELDTTETWELHNKTSVAHLMHMHHTDWYMLSRNGKLPRPWERCLKETFFLEPGDRIIVAGHFSDYTGKYVIHCHMLDHEDHGMMTQFEVVEPEP